ncbi:MAG: hypothetical protein AB7O45_02700 [Alphaproteobacteria bacterium]
MEFEEPPFVLQISGGPSVDGDAVVVDSTGREGERIFFAIPRDDTGLVCIKLAQSAAAAAERAEWVRPSTRQEEVREVWMPVSAGGVMLDPEAPADVVQLVLEVGPTIFQFRLLKAAALDLGRHLMAVAAGAVPRRPDA